MKGKVNIQQHTNLDGRKVKYYESQSPCAETSFSLAKSAVTVQSQLFDLKTVYQLVQAQVRLDIDV
jgi:hypothetical protein